MKAGAKASQKRKIHKEKDAFAFVLADKTLFDLHAVFSRENIGIARKS